MTLLNIFNRKSRDREIMELKYKIGYLEKEQKRYEKLKKNIMTKTIDLDFKVNFASKIELFFNKIFNKKKLNIIFISNNKEVFLKYIFYNNKNYFNIKDKAFVFEGKNFYVYKNQPILFIYEDQPIPLEFKNECEIKNVPFDSKTFKDAMETKIIQDVLQKDKGLFGMDIDKNTIIIFIVIIVFIFMLSQGYLDDLFTH